MALASHNLECKNRFNESNIASAEMLHPRDTYYRAVGEEDILVEIERCISAGPAPAGRAARDYYRSGNLPFLVERYFRQRGVTKRNRQAQVLGVSAQTLNRIFSGADISENMLFRFRVAIHRAALIKNYDKGTVEQILHQPWRDNRGSRASGLVMRIIADAGVLIDRLRISNSIGSPGDVMSSEQKEQLISLLKELIAKLEAPVVNAEEADTALSRIGEAFKSGATKAIEEDTKAAAASLLRNGRQYVIELVKEKGWAALTSFFN